MSDCKMWLSVMCCNIIVVSVFSITAYTAYISLNVSVLFIKHALSDGQWAKINSDASCHN